MRGARRLAWLCCSAVSVIAQGMHAPAMAADPCLDPAASAVIGCLAPDTRGIKPGAAARAVAPRPQAGGRPRRIDYTLPFATGSAAPAPAALLSLDGFGRALDAPELAGMHFRIEGHTDTTGDRQLNLTLSQRRAETVVAYLTQKFPQAGGRLTAVGKGQSDLPVPTAAQVDEPRNRIVRIVPESN